MDWSYEQDMIISALERLLAPKEYIDHYFCCFRIRRTKID